MKDLRNKKIERIERRLLKAHLIQTEELREIVSAPRVLDGINARIKAEKVQKRSKKRRTILSLWNWQKVGLAVGGLAVVLTGALSLLFFAEPDLSLSKLNKSVSAPEIQKPASFIEDTEPQFTKAEKQENSFGGSRNISEKISFKNKKLKSVIRKPKINPARALPLTEKNKTEGVFYPLAFAESLEEAKENGQIIRVELSRSSLLALGLNPPMDDETLKIKTDLLIGSDGIARGIRFIE